MFTRTPGGRLLYVGDIIHIFQIGLVSNGFRWVENQRNLLAGSHDARGIVTERIGLKRQRKVARSKTLLRKIFFYTTSLV